MADVEQLRALEKERPLLREARLERRQVDLGGIGFDLAEVRIDRGLEREVRTKTHLDVGADAALRGSCRRRTGCRDRDRR